MFAEMDETRRIVAPRLAAVPRATLTSPNPSDRGPRFRPRNRTPLPSADCERERAYHVGSRLSGSSHRSFELECEATFERFLGSRRRVRRGPSRPPPSAQERPGEPVMWRLARSRKGLFPGTSRSLAGSTPTLPPAFARHSGRKDPSPPGEGDDLGELALLRVPSLYLRSLLAIGRYCEGMLKSIIKQVDDNKLNLEIMLVFPVFNA
jgi:hypothetical protein